MDGVDAAYLVSDGETIGRRGAFVSRPYDADFRARLRAVLGGNGPVDAVARELTQRHADTVLQLLEESDLKPGDIDVIGFHGHTIMHRPEAGRTWQIGDGALLAKLTGIDVVADFRSADVAAGGEGAPLAPLYHHALARKLDKPLCFLNIGGVANVTWIGEDGTIIAFDTGPGNALIDDWMQTHTGTAVDQDGKAAAGGNVDAPVLQALLDNPYFDRPAPKSLDRDDFSSAPARALSPRDGAATLTAFTARAVGLARGHMPHAPRRWLVCGGGRHNPTLLASLRDVLAARVEPVETEGWRGDAIEAEAFAFLAVRSLRGLPLSLPSTTGVAAPTTGGRYYKVG